MAAGSAELERFIEQALIAGHPRAAVQRALLDAGWSQAQIDGAMQQWASVDFPLPLPPTTNSPDNDSSPKTVTRTLSATPSR